MSCKPMYRVQEDVASLRQLVSIVSNGLQRNACAVEKLKREMTQVGGKLKGEITQVGGKLKGEMTQVGEKLKGEMTQVGGMLKGGNDTGRGKT